MVDGVSSLPNGNDREQQVKGLIPPPGALGHGPVRPLKPSSWLESCFPLCPLSSLSVDRVLYRRNGKKFGTLTCVHRQTSGGVGETVIDTETPRRTHSLVERWRGMSVTKIERTYTLNDFQES